MPCVTFIKIYSLIHKVLKLWKIESQILFANSVECEIKLLLISEVKNVILTFYEDIHKLSHASLPPSTAVKQWKKSDQQWSVNAIWRVLKKALTDLHSFVNFWPTFNIISFIQFKAILQRINSQTFFARVKKLYKKRRKYFNQIIEGTKKW